MTAMSNSNGREDFVRTLLGVYRSIPGTRDLSDHPSTEMTEVNQTNREDYVRSVLEAYGSTPGTCGKIRCADRDLAREFFRRGIPLQQVQNALVLALSRRVLRPPDAPPLGIVRSLAYFVPVIDEVLNNRDRVKDEYYQHLRSRLQQLGHL